ncbi:DUF3822 family protein [Echinicola vietnamensis]|uniref:DUF3822 domain-containing protein n=1 Tax=Echinicola vietnamensis (strain DSM 17526 / LMG 23754 / KMM 6221) TaxID=926556 RepID=L0FYU3_ECHVK|nr:DUF3822 family protein [Echinicola vietnamensis]AGA78467.1 hypothetical protein Echvi_2217 [Echinicola vietnamensis DSM 17526]
MAKTVTNTHTEFHCDKLDVANTSSLSLLFYPQRLIVLAKNQNGLVIGVNDYPFVEDKELEMILEKDLFVSQMRSQCETTLYVFSPDFCLVPSVLFDASEVQHYLNFSVETTGKDAFYSHLNDSQLVIVGGIDSTLLAIFGNHIKNLTLRHGSSLAIAYLLGEKADMLNQELAVVIEDHEMYVAGFINKELKFFNRFEVRNNQDFLKYSFSVLHQLAFDRMHCKITLYGNLDEINVQEQVLRKYFKNIEITTPKPSQNYLPGAESFRETKKLEAFWAS